MKISDVNFVINLLNERADDLKDRVECRKKYSSRLEYLTQLVKNSSFSAEDKFSLCNLILEKQADLDSVVYKYNSEIEILDNFVGEISQSINDNDGTCIYIDMECDVNV